MEPNILSNTTNQMPPPQAIADDQKKPTREATGTTGSSRQEGADAGPPLSLSASSRAASNESPPQSPVEPQEIRFLIAYIRDIGTKIPAASKALNNLRRVREQAAMQRPWYLFFRRPTEIFWMAEGDINAIADLQKIQARWDSNGRDGSSVLSNLMALKDRVDMKVRELESMFLSLLYSATTSKEIIDDLLGRIGHHELKDEAEMHLGVVSTLVERLDRQQVAGGDIDVLGQTVSGAVAIMTELEGRKIRVQALVRKDRRRRLWTIGCVISYIALVLAAGVYAGIQWRALLLIGDRQLGVLKLPLLDIPWPVVVWSLIGSFAAMIYQFNKNPIYDFGDAVKWLLTRPAQGVVLGSAFYLVLISGLFLLSGAPADPSTTKPTNDLILILSFLVGFSDRFADSVFDTIVKKYTQLSGPNDRKKPAEEKANG